MNLFIRIFAKEDYTNKSKEPQFTKDCGSCS